jgi:hypothetical protein
MTVHRPDSGDGRDQSHYEHRSVRRGAPKISAEDIIETFADHNFATEIAFLAELVKVPTDKIRTPPRTRRGEDLAPISCFGLCSIVKLIPWGLQTRAEMER